MTMTPVVVASHNGAIGFPAAFDILRSGGSALDAVEAAARLVEDNLEDTSVGRGGLPNLLGQVELDALIMDGKTLQSGSVAALQGYPNPVSVARKVMEQLPHALLVGEGAARFAGEMGFEPATLTNENTLRIWRERLDWELPYYQKMRDLAAAMAQDPELAARQVTNGKSVTGTVNPSTANRGQNRNNRTTQPVQTAAAAATRGPLGAASGTSAPRKHRCANRNADRPPTKDGGHQGIASRKSPAAENSTAGSSQRRSRAIGWPSTATASSTAIRAFTAGCNQN